MLPPATEYSIRKPTEATAVTSRTSGQFRYSTLRSPVGTCLDAVFQKAHRCAPQASVLAGDCPVTRVAQRQFLQHRLDPAALAGGIGLQRRQPVRHARAAVMSRAMGAAAVDPPPPCSTTTAHRIARRVAGRKAHEQRMVAPVPRQIVVRDHARLRVRPALMLRTWLVPVLPAITIVGSTIAAGLGRCRVRRSPPRTCPAARRPDIRASMPSGGGLGHRHLLVVRPSAPGAAPPPARWRSAPSSPPAAAARPAHSPARSRR